MNLVHSLKIALLSINPVVGLTVHIELPDIDV